MLLIGNIEVAVTDAGANIWRSSARLTPGASADAAYARLEAALSPPLLSSLIKAARSDDSPWIRQGAAKAAFEVRAVRDELETRLIEALAAAGVDARPEGFLRHEAGDAGLPDTPAGGAFLIDLNEDWRSEDGGLLLFATADDQVRGWTPRQGVVTLYGPDRPPVLTLVTPSARGPRLAVWGSLA